MNKDIDYKDFIITFTPVIAVVIPWILNKTQSFRKEKVVKTSEITNIYTQNINVSMIYILISLILTIPITFLLGIACYYLHIALFSSKMILTISIPISILSLQIMTSQSKNIRKKIIKSFCKRKILNIILFYFPSLLIIIELTLSLYIKLEDKLLNNIIVITIMVLPTIIILFYFMAIKRIDKYEGVIIYFNNSYMEKYEKYENYSVEEGFVVIRKKVNGEFIVNKYNNNIIDRVVVRGTNIDRIYKEHLKKRGFLY